MSTDNFLTCMEWKLQLGSRKKCIAVCFLHDCRAEKCPDNQEQKRPVRGSERRSSVAGDSSIREPPCCSPGRACAARVEHRRPEHLLLREQRTFLSGNNVADYQITRKGSRGLNKVCRICEICGHVNKKRRKNVIAEISAQINLRKIL